MRIWWRWSWSPGGLAFGLVLTAVAAGLVWRGSGPGSQGIWIGLLVASLVIVAIAGYDTFANLRNRTEVQVRPDRIDVLHGPVPRTINRSVERAQIAQLFVESRPGVHGTRYALAVVLRNGERRNLVTGLDEAHAFYLEEELERRLGLEDLPVPGQAPRRRQ